MWIQLLCFVESSDELLGCYEFEDHKLPDKFEPGMGLELDGTQWYILSAQPDDVRDYKHKGEVFLRLSKTAPRKKPKPRDVPQESHAHFDRYSMATMCATMPAFDANRTVSTRTLLIHEDDWRQAEFIAPHYRRQVVEEMEDIESMSRRQMVGSKMHLRSRVAAPMMPLDLSLHDVLRLFPRHERFDGVSFRAKTHLIEEGFAFKTSRGTTFYGTTYGGMVEVMCLHSFDPDLNDQPDLQTFLDILPPEACFIPWLLIGWVVERRD